MQNLTAFEKFRGFFAQILENFIISFCMVFRLSMHYSCDRICAYYEKSSYTAAGVQTISGGYSTSVTVFALVFSS